MLRGRVWIVSGKFLGEAPLGSVVKAEFGRMRDPAVALALSFGLGLVPWMPGTFGAAGRTGSRQASGYTTGSPTTRLR